MQPRQYTILKWCVYGGATLALCLVQTCLLRFVRVWEVVPFLYPMLAAVVSTYEGRRGGPIFAVVLGALCDLALQEPFPPGFYTFCFALAGILAAVLAEFLLTPGLLCSLAAAAGAFLITDLGRLLVLLGNGQGAAGAILWVALREFLVTLPLLPLVFWTYRRIHRRVSEEY